MPDSYSSQLVVDGIITNEPGPYTVKLSQSTRVENFLLFHRDIIAGASITISDNLGNSELLIEAEPGVYKTKENGIQGVIGREYALKIEMSNGKVYESLPDKMNPVGELDSLYYEFESFLPLNDQERYGFRFYVNSQSPVQKETFLRWRFTGIFEIAAYPELHIFGNCIPDPRLCGGFVWTEFGLKRQGDCTCCTCWVTVNEKQPHVSDNQFVSNGKSKKIEVGYIPLEYFPFQAGKYRVEVQQMSLSKNAFNYWRIIQSQKEGAASLFQPPTGKIRTNIFETTGCRFQNTVINWTCFFDFRNTQ